MRLTFSTGYREALADLERAGAELARRQREVSSGRRLATASDDPSAMAAAITERADLASLDRYAQATESVGSRLQVMDTVLSDMVSRITAARVAGMAARGNTFTSEQRQAAAAELRGIRDAIHSDINSVFRGTFLFSGAASTTAPYQRAADGTLSAYQGDSQPVWVDIDHHRAVRVTLDGDALLRGSDSRHLLTVLDDAVAHLEAGDMEAVGADMEALSRAFDRVVSEQSRVGSDLKVIEDQGARLGALKLEAKGRVSSLEDANMVESISAMTQADAIYQAALGAIGQRARLSLLDFLR